MRIHAESSDCWCEPKVIVVEPDARVIVHHPDEWDQFRAFRADGWPLCPSCGDDELWTPWTPPVDQTACLDDYVANKLRCLMCGWISR